MTAANLTIAAAGDPWHEYTYMYGFSKGYRYYKRIFNIEIEYDTILIRGITVILIY